MKIRTLMLTVLATTVLAGNAFACGDSLYLVGKGVSYRIYTAPLPGSVLVYGQSEDAEMLAQALAHSGHGVRFVSSSEELESELKTGDYDVVIAAYKDHSAVESTIKESARSTTFLPVAQSDDEEKQAEQEYDEVMVAEQDGVKHYLKAIHKTLKQSG